MADKNIFLNSGVHKADVPLNTFDKSFTNHLTARFGRAIPCFLDFVPANSYVNVNTNMAFDLMPLVFPLQSPITAHVSFFTCAIRNVWPNFKDFLVGIGNHVMPYISRTDNWTKTGSLADYLGVPSTSLSLQSLISSLTCSFRFLDFSLLSSLVPETSDFALNDLFPSSSSSSIVGNSSRYIAFVSDVIQKLANNTTSLANFTLKFDSPFSVNSSQITQARLRVLYTRHTLIDGHDNYRYFNLSSDFSFSSVQRNGVYSNTLSFSNLDNVEVLNTLIREGYDCKFFVTVLTTNSNLSYPFLDRPSFTGELAPSSDDKQILSVSSTLSYLSEILPSTFTYSSIEYSHRNTTDSYFEGTSPRLPVNALAFRVYEFIGNYFFRNRQIDPFKINNVVQANNFLTNKGDGADSTTPVDFFNVPYEYDIYTTALLNPQLGNAPLVGVTTNSDEVDTALANITFVPLSNGQYDYENAYQVGVIFNPESGSALAVSNYESNADKPNIKRLSELISAGISINDLRNVSAFQRYLEKMQRTASQYENFVQEFFGVTPPTGENFPNYIGGFDRQISIGKILNNAAGVNAQGENVPLGAFAGVGAYRQDGDRLPHVRTFCAEDSIVIGLVWFSVTPVYSQQISAHLLKSDKLEFFNPIFNGIGPQPIPNKLIAPLQCSDEELDDVFGYQRPWFEYIMKTDEAHGAFRDTMSNYLLQRQFLTPPALSPDFIYVHSDQLSNVFSYALDDDKIFGCIRFDYKLACPVARISVPKIMV